MRGHDLEVRPGTDFPVVWRWWWGREGSNVTLLSVAWVIGWVSGLFTAVRVWHWLLNPWAVDSSGLDWNRGLPASVKWGHIGTYFIGSEDSMSQYLCSTQVPVQHFGSMFTVLGKTETGLVGRPKNYFGYVKSATLSRQMSLYGEKATWRKRQGQRWTFGSHLHIDIMESYRTRWDFLRFNKCKWRQTPYPLEMTWTFLCREQSTPFLRGRHMSINNLILGERLPPTHFSWLLREEETS